MVIYKTKSGELWDEVAFHQLRDCKYVSNLMDANKDKLEYFVFPAGVELILPEIESETATADLPAWFN